MKSKNNLNHYYKKNINAYLIKNIDILKASHHGRETGFMNLPSGKPHLHHHFLIKFQLTTPQLHRTASAVIPFLLRCIMPPQLSHLKTPNKS